MAIIGNIYHLKKRLSYKHIGIVFDYCTKVLDKDSDESKQLFSLPMDSFEKVTLTDGIIAFLQVATTKIINECFIESHLKYVDFQLLVAGVEEMHYVDTQKLIIDVPYNNEKDLIIYRMYEDTSKFLLETGDLAIFFPEDAHIGLSMYHDPCVIRKVVIKVPLILLQDKV